MAEVVPAKDAKAPPIESSAASRFNPFKLEDQTVGGRNAAPRRYASFASPPPRALPRSGNFFIVDAPVVSELPGHQPRLRKAPAGGPVALGSFVRPPSKKKPPEKRRLL